MFVNRETELNFLEEHYESEQAEFVVLYGRRRVGKTDLLHQFCQGKPYIFFVADLGTDEANLAHFSCAGSQYIHGDPDVEGPFRDWDQGLSRVARLAEEQRLILVIDEFTYLVEAQEGIVQAETPGLGSELEAVTGAYGGGHVGENKACFQNVGPAVPLHRVQVVELER